MHVLAVPGEQRSMSRDLTAFIARIQGQLPDVTPRELSELLWLGAQLGEPTIRPATPEPVPLPVQPTVDETSPAPAAASPTPIVNISAGSTSEMTPDISMSSSPRADARRLRGRLARPMALEDGLLWSRALHRLGKLDAVGPLAVDAIATVQHAAKLDDLQLILRPRPQPVTWLVIVEDCAGQLAPWQQSIGMLARLARRSGRFVQVRHLRVDLGDPQTATLADADAPALQHALASAGQPGQPLLVLLVSDGLAPGLSALTRALAHLPATAAVAWMHPWGTARWSATPLLATLPRGRPRPLQPRDPRPLRPALVPWSPAGLASLAAWALGRGAQGIYGIHFPVGSKGPARSGPKPTNIDWEERGRQLALVLEPGTQQLLALAAGVPGSVDLDMFWAFAGSSGRTALTTVPISRYNLAEALSSGLLERDRSKPGLVIRFRDDDTNNTSARSAALRWLDSEQAARPPRVPRQPPRRRGPS
jgi:hypothetical protein